MVHSWSGQVRWSAPTLWAQAQWKVVQRALRTRRLPRIPGACPFCRSERGFVRTDDNPRDGALCRSCGSVPRQRALLLALQQLHGDLTPLRIHESSPGHASFAFFRRACAQYTPSHWFEGGAGRVGAFANVDLQRQPFADRTFDVVVTQDVLEHVLDPASAVREIHRTLRPGGAHIFTVPRADYRATAVRARCRDGVVELLAAPEYHGNPIAAAGSLVATDWGVDLEAWMARECGVACVRQMVCAPAAGVPQPIEVFVAR